MRHTLISLVLATSVCPAPAQNPVVVGLTGNTPLVLQQETGSCTLAQCAPAGFPQTLIPFAGGTAYDHTDSGIWITNGLVIAKVDRNGCGYLCPPTAIPGISPNNAASGLAYNELTNTMFVTDLAGFIRTYDVNGCVLTQTSQCLAPPNTPNFFLTGIATDDRSSIVYYCVTAAQAPGGRVFVANQSNPCNPFCNFSIVTCGGNTMGPLQGLAYDACSARIWATDGKDTVGGDYLAAACAFQEVQCCSQSVDRYVGLCVMPAPPRSDGTPCTSGGCAPCPNLEHVFLNGDPTIGNSGFTLDLVNAPGQTNTWLVLNFGPCAPPGISSPFFCGPLLVPFAPPWFVLGSFPTGGTAGACDGGASFPLPIPNWASLCGVTLSSQWVGICFGNPFGSYVSNCLSWTIGGM